MKFLILFFIFMNSIAFSAEDNRPAKLTRSQKKQLAEIEQLTWNFQAVEMYRENEVLLKRLEQRLSQGQIIGLELVVAAPTDMRFESKWGHAMMRFVDTVRSSSNDIVISFVADLNSPATNYVKGAIGGYPVFPMLKTFSGFVEQYIKGEDRKLERFIIPTDQKILKQMIGNLRNIWNEIQQKNETSLLIQTQKLAKKLNKMQKQKKHQIKEIHAIEHMDYTIGYTFENESEAAAFAVALKNKKSRELKGYTFLKNNCAGALINFLRATAFPFIGRLGMKGRIPVELDTYLDKYFLSSFPSVIVDSVVPIKSKLELLMGLNYLELNQFENWEKISVHTLIQSLSTSELMILMNQNDLAIPPSMQDKILNYLGSVQNKPTYDQLYGIQELDQQLYPICTTNECANAQLEIAKTVFDSKSLEQKLKSHKKKIKNKKQNSFYHQLIQYNELLFKNL